MFDIMGAHCTGYYFFMERLVAVQLHSVASVAVAATPLSQPEPKVCNVELLL